ncbi:hypothetical protein [Microvirus mar40]|uniref:Uncharacterized protein n=1 Tax=Microvirus mar40 TaxID=2851175 RepID=A0A8F6AI45_9VIRU|nr:hypothetical protein [Microvirus mar40]
MFGYRLHAISKSEETFQQNKFQIYNNMKTAIIKDKHNIQSVETYEAESIETKVRRILDENEPITDGAPIIYTEKADGVKPEYNIRTDRWQIAIDAMDKVSSYEASKYLKSGEKVEMKIEEKTEQEKTGTAD